MNRIRFHFWSVDRWSVFITPLTGGAFSYVVNIFQQVAVVDRRKTSTGDVASKLYHQFLGSFEFDSFIAEGRKSPVVSLDLYTDWNSKKSICQICICVVHVAHFRFNNSCLYLAVLAALHFSAARLLKLIYVCIRWFTPYISLIKNISFIKTAVSMYNWRKQGAMPADLAI